MVDDIEHEYRRLLYVAMTRAAERLIVGGVQPGNRKDVPPAPWYQLITKGLETSDSHVREFDTKDGVVRRYTRPRTRSARRGSTAQRRRNASCCSRRTGFTRRLRRSRPRSSSGGRRMPPTKATVPARRDGARPQQALRRGVLVHRLLQSLPEIAADRRRAARTAIWRATPPTGPTTNAKRSPHR